MPARNTFADILQVKSNPVFGCENSLYDQFKSLVLFIIDCFMICFFMIPGRACSSIMCDY